MGVLRAADLDRLRAAELTYPDVGATFEGRCPPGWPSLERTAVVGSGRPAFERAAAVLFGWGCQRGAGLRVRATGPASEPGAVVVLTVGLRRLGYDIPCRVVWARTDGDERGFGYGTLPGHPETGEEAFLLRLEPDGRVVFTTRVFSRLVSPAARAAGALARSVQRLALSRYAAAMHRAAQD